MSPMASFVAVLGVVSGIAHPCALLPAHGWRQRATHVIYGLFIAVLATLAFNYQSKIAVMARHGEPSGCITEDNRHE